MTPINPLLAVCLIAAASGSATSSDICDKTARMQKKSAGYELKEELESNLAACINLTNRSDRAECQVDAYVEFAEGKELAKEQYEARLELCELLGGGAYDPEIDPDNFVSDIDNPYLPLPVGACWSYVSETEDGMETIEVTVLAETREILGVECVSVRDVVFLEGEPVEDTIDWYAQDIYGNVWYFGEISFSFEDGYVESIEGSWLSGRDGAKPGIVMMGTPTAETTYRQEWLLGEAEDAATVLNTDVPVTLDGFPTFEHCVQTADFLPPEPDALEFKFYAPGIGFIYETKDDSPETVVLVSYSGL